MLVKHYILYLEGALTEQRRRKKKGALIVPGEYLQELCNQRNWTWHKLGEVANLDPSLISRAFQGKVKPHPETVEALCMALDVIDEDTLDEIYLSFKQVREEQYSKAIESLKRKTEELRKKRQGIQ